MDWSWPGWNAIAAIGQAAGAVFTAIAARFAARAVWATAEDVEAVIDEFSVAYYRVGNR
jgi:hypothetical protein